MLSGTTSREKRNYERRHRIVSRQGAEEGIVLLKNQDQVLPISKSQKIAVYGSGAFFTIKGGNGSGDVNTRDVVSIWEGLKNAGYQIANQAWGKTYIKKYEQARMAWRENIWEKADKQKETNNLWDVYVSTPFAAPVGSLPNKKEADVALYVVSRTSSEACDRRLEEGDYYLSKEEKIYIEHLADLYENIVLILNTCGVIDLEILDTCPHIKSVLLIGQAGMEAGNAVASVISGEVTPSGKLASTWALHYEDYPGAANYSYLDGNVEEEVYEEGIYVGYRYFDTFQIPVRYGFGFGLSYTSFCMRTQLLNATNLKTENPVLGLGVQVENTGNYKGKEVVEVYAVCPQEKLKKEFRRLIGFRKTRVLEPGEIQELYIEIPMRGLTSYCEKIPGWVMEKGIYGICVGNSLENSRLIGSVKVEKDLIFERTEHICRPCQVIQERMPESSMQASQIKNILKEAEAMPQIILQENAVVAENIFYDSEDNIGAKAKSFVEKLSPRQLIELTVGNVMTGQGAQIGSAGSRVPGSAAQTSAVAKEQGLPDIVLADGPAGLRLTREYYVIDGVPLKLPMEKALENGFLYRGEDMPAGETYYQFCTAFPTGTVLAQTWNPEVLTACGRAMAEELQEFGVEILLAPGMNIHRNPLCGRNFEYFSEDPVVSGLMATAITKGIQSIKHCAATIKHFACNSQEDNRFHANSIMSERTLREIYLRGFEIAVKMANPICIMTSYNLVNGIHAANNYDLCTKVLRKEWKYQGLIMTDWTSTNNDENCTASGCMRAGNELVMPGMLMDYENMEKELENGTLNFTDIKRCAARVAEIVWRLTE